MSFSYHQAILLIQCSLSVLKYGYSMVILTRYVACVSTNMFEIRTHSFINVFIPVLIFHKVQKIASSNFHAHIKPIRLHCPIYNTFTHDKML